MRAAACTRSTPPPDRRCASPPGFLGATDVSVGANGSIYVVELFAGQVAPIGPNGARSVVASLPGVVSVEYGNGQPVCRDDGA